MNNITFAPYNRINQHLPEEAYENLPLPPRCYIDPCAHEFGEATVDEKLYHMGCMAIRSKHFYRYLKDNIDYKKKNPQYGGYEECACQTFAHYISYLRTGDYLSLSFYALEALPFRKLYLLLVRELKLRYYETLHISSGCQVYEFHPYNFDDEELIRRFKGNGSGLKAYLMTDQETRRMMKEEKKRITNNTRK